MTATLTAPKTATGWRVLLAAALLVEALAFAVFVLGHISDRAFWVYAIGFPVFGVAVVALARARIDPRTALIAVVAAGAVFQVVVLSTPPISSDDAYRYGWDAKVQLAGIDPYRYTPADPVLDGLRSRALFAPDTGHCAWPLPDDVCSRINRPTVHTIYPPVAEGAFTVSRVLSLGRTDGTEPVQVLAALGAIAISALLAWSAFRRRRPAWTVALWAWCPLTVIELGNNAHIDWLAVLLSVAALTVGRERAAPPGDPPLGVAPLGDPPIGDPSGRRADRRTVLAGALVGAAIATKIYPALIGASLLRRHPVRVISAAIGVVALSYVPHVAAVGSAVVGFLPDYVKQENYLSGGRFLALSLFLPEAARPFVAVLIIVAVLLWAVRRTDPRAPEATAVVTFGVVLMVTTPVYSWYALLLLALIAMTGRVAWLPMVVGAAMSMVGSLLVPHHVIAAHTVCYVSATVLTLILLRVVPAPQPEPRLSSAAG